MGFSSPSVETPPPAVTYDDIQDNQGTVERAKNRAKFAKAVNTKSTILTTQTQPNSAKTLLGQ